MKQIVTPLMYVQCTKLSSIVAKIQQINHVLLILFITCIVQYNRFGVDMENEIKIKRAIAVVFHHKCASIVYHF